MLPSLVHLRQSRTTGTLYGLPENRRIAFVTIEHERRKPKDVKVYDENGQLIPQLGDKVYGTLRIAVQAQADLTNEEVWQFREVSLVCFRSAAIEAYDAVADVAKRQAEAEEQAHGGRTPLGYQSPIDHFYYLRRHVVVIPQGANNLNPQQFLQRDFGNDLTFARNVLYESLGNLSMGRTLVEVLKFYDGAAQDVNALNEEAEARRARAQNLEPEPIFYMETDDDRD